MSLSEQDFAMLDERLEAIADAIEPRCRFNCRTPREIFDAGVVCGKQGTDPDKVWRKLRDGQRRQTKTPASK